MADLYEWMSTETKEDKKVVFGFDKDGRLYINGERVVTEQKVILQMWLNVALALGALGALAQGVVAVIGLIRSL